MKKHLIIDGNNLVHRAYWISNNREAANHIFIVLRSLKSYVEQFKPDKIWCAWDMRLSSEPTLRKQIDTEYKQTRDVDYNKQVHEQTDLIAEFFKILGVCNIYPTRGEADDIIFWLTSELDGKKTVISADTDFFQLIKEDVDVYSPIKKVIYNREAFKENFGFMPENYPLYKSITGDKADNILGLDKFGPKKALQIIEKSIKLSEEQQAIINSNLQLINLDNRGDSRWDEEYKTYAGQIEARSEADFQTFLEMCEQQRFISIINQQTLWHKAFFIKNVMNSLIAELFSK